MRQRQSATTFEAVTEHLLLRWAGRPDTVEQHRSLAETNGFVWWGRWASSNRDREPLLAVLREQIDNGEITYVYLRNDRSEWRATLSDARTASSRPPHEEYPAYYPDGQVVDMWLRLNDFEPLELGWMERNLAFAGGRREGELIHYRGQNTVYRVKANEGSGVRIRNSDGVELDAEFSVDQQGSTSKLTIESRGGGRNQDYEPAFALAVDRLLNAGWDVVNALLASNDPKVRQATVAERQIFGPADYPLSGSGSEITSALRNEAKQMFREPDARPGGGNATKRIEVFFSHPDSNRIFQSDLEAGVPGAPRASDVGPMLSEVLRLQHEYVSTNSPAMQARGLLIRDDIPGQLRAWLSDRKSPPSTEGRDGTGRKTRVPWVRIFDPRQSPSATDGWYVVFLFAADGSAVYLSLNQGTTDFVNGEFRAKSEEVLEARVLAARSLVSDQASSSWNPPLETDMQLHDVGSLGEGYERGNVVARRYDADAIPDEGVLRDDLTRMLDLLSVVQEADLGRSDSPGPLEETSANPAREINPVSKVPEPADASKDFEWLLSQTLWDRSDLEEIVETIEERRPQVVLAGPPGTGKTWVAESIALYLTQGRKDSVRTVQFHPTYGYEDFVEGLRPVAGDEGNVVFDTVEGTLVEIADHARRVDHPVVLVIDEMNRANLPSVFGELLYLLEYRDKTISLLHRDEFSLPGNLKIIATMNTADRSIRSRGAA